jgi:hypothetical protein
MADLNVVEIKAFLPAKDFAFSKEFHQDLGFTIEWFSDEMADLRCGTSSVLLNNFYQKECAENLMIHLQVEAVDAWWQRVTERNLAAKYGQHGVHAVAPGGAPVGHEGFLHQRSQRRALTHRSGSEPQEPLTNTSP